jgi:hypothetical protein
VGVWPQRLTQAWPSAAVLFEAFRHFHPRAVANVVHPVTVQFSLAADTILADFNLGLDWLTGIMYVYHAALCLACATPLIPSGNWECQAIGGHSACYGFRLAVLLALAASTKAALHVGPRLHAWLRAVRQRGAAAAHVPLGGDRAARVRGDSFESRSE